jgi:general secretion pathway protein K
MRRRAPRASERGVALLMVLVALTLLTLIVADFTETTQIDLATAANDRDEMRAGYLARSGVNLSRLFLAMGPTLGQFMGGDPGIWQYADLILEPFNGGDSLSGIGAAVGIDMSEAQGFGGFDGRFTVQLVPEDSKLNLNAAWSPRYQDSVALVLANLVVDPKYDAIFSEANGGADRETVITSIIDYIDPDTNMYGTSASAEDGYYETLPDSYERKNAPLDSLEELHLVRGIGDSFWNAFVDPDPFDPSLRQITVWGSGSMKTNPFFAPPTLLLAYLCAAATTPTNTLCTDPMVALAFAEQWGLIAPLLALGGQEGFQLAVEQTAQAVGAPDFALDRQKTSTFFDFTNSTFSIYAEAEVGRVFKRLHVVVHMGRRTSAGGGRLLYWREG